MPSDPVDAAGDLAGPMMAVERVAAKAGGRAAKGLVEPAKNYMGQASDALKRFMQKSHAVDELGDPLTMYHGTNAPDIEVFDKPINWFSEAPSLANSYAAVRGAKTAGDNVMPAYLRAEKSFDADALGRYSSVGQMVGEIAKQAGRSPDNDAKLKKLYTVLRDNAVREGSGDRFQPHDFWYPGAFGKDGQEAVLSTLKELGFDSVKLKERGVGTLGVLDPKQIKSATGNSGAFDPNDPSIMKSLLPYLMYGLKPSEKE